MKSISACLILVLCQSVFSLKASAVDSLFASSEPLKCKSSNGLIVFMFDESAQFQTQGTLLFNGSISEQYTLICKPISSATAVYNSVQCEGKGVMVVDQEYVLVYQEGGLAIPSAVLTIKTSGVTDQHISLSCKI